VHAAPAAQNLLCEAAASAVVGAATVVTIVADAVVAASVDLAAFVVTVISAAGRMTFKLSLAAMGLFTVEPSLHLFSLLTFSNSSVPASVDIAAFVVTVIPALGRMTFELSLAAMGLFTVESSLLLFSLLTFSNSSVPASVDIAAFVVTVIPALGRMTFELSLAATGLFTVESSLLLFSLLTFSNSSVPIFFSEESEILFVQPLMIRQYCVNH
jgi:hypothetical protein